MQAFGLLVLDFDGSKIQSLAELLRSQGYSVVTTSLSESDSTGIAATPPPLEIVDGGDPGAPDNDLPYKCPLCGRTYTTQVVCDVQHEPTETLPTADVLAGGTPSAPTPAEEPTAEPAPEPVAEGGLSTTAEPAPAAPAPAAPVEPIAAATPADPSPPSTDDTPALVPTDPAWPTA